jgi:hypothetical protein
MGWNHVFGYFGPIKWSCLIIGSHPKRIETCFLVVIDDLKWYLVPILLFSGKLSHFSIFFRVAAGDSFRSSNPNHQYHQLVYLSLVPRCPEASNWSDLPARRPHFNIHKRWVVFWTCETICFFVGMVLLQFLYSQEPLKEFEQIKQHAWKFKFLN